MGKDEKSCDERLSDALVALAVSLSGENLGKMISVINSQIKDYCLRRDGNTGRDMANVLAVAVLRIAKETKPESLDIIARELAEAEILALVFPSRAVEIADAASTQADLIALLVPAEIVGICRKLSPEALVNVVGTMVKNHSKIGYHPLADTEVFRRYFPAEAERFGKSAEDKKKG
ncbi:MAG: hypothetical protein WC473_05515 [Patescibacteria group bacterium]|jgi:hypothetical protein